MKPFAIYFPQFYPTATNDVAWGHGFTDWALVSTANLYDRWQRRAPLRGFYDGSQPELHRSQMQQMHASGLGGLALFGDIGQSSLLNHEIQVLKGVSQ